MFTQKVLAEGAVKIGKTGAKLHRAKRIEYTYEAGTSHPMAGKSTVETVILCACGCKGARGARYVQFYANTLPTCGDVRS